MKFPVWLFNYENTTDLVDVAFWGGLLQDTLRPYSGVTLYSHVFIFLFFGNATEK